MSVRIEELKETCEMLGESELFGKEIAIITVRMVGRIKTFEIWAWLNEGTDDNPLCAAEWSAAEWEQWIQHSVEEEDKKSRGRKSEDSVYAIMRVNVV